MLIQIKKVVLLATKAELKAEQDKIIKLQAFNSICFRGKSQFEDDGTQNYILLQPIYRYFKKIDNTNYISLWKSKGLSNEIIKPCITSHNKLAPALSYIGNKTRVEFDESGLKQDRITITHGKIVNIYIVYEIDLWNYVNSSDPALGNSLFCAVKLVKNADIDKYKYFVYDIAFDMKGTFLFLTGGFGKNVIIFVVDMSSYVHMDNKKKYILILGEGLTQGLDDRTLDCRKKVFN